jgi:hypothetical protein
MRNRLDAGRLRRNERHPNDRRRAALDRSHPAGAVTDPVGAGFVAPLADAPWAAIAWPEILQAGSNPMSYEPSERLASFRQVAAAWLACLSIAAGAFGLPALWDRIDPVVGTTPASGYAAAPGGCPAKAPMCLANPDRQGHGGSPAAVASASGENPRTCG